MYSGIAENVDTADVVTAVLIALGVFDWIAVAILYRAASGQHIKSLDSRARVALLIAIASSLAAALGVNRHVGIIPPGLGWFVLVVIVMLPSLGNVAFLWDLWRGKFRA